jgi:hypothetical protein
VERMMKNVSMSAMSTSLPTPVLIDKYLQVFGVVQISKDLPLVFDPQYDKVWAAVLTDRRFASKDPKLKLLLTILDFVKFMRQQRINPFVTINGKGLNSNIRPVDMTKDLLKSEIQFTYTTIQNYLRKSGIMSYMKLDKRLVQISLDKSTILLNFGFVPIRKESIERIINYDLKGTLYRSTIPPMQLQVKTPSNMRSFNTVITTLNTSKSDWVPLMSINNFKVYARATKDALAVRVTIPINFDYIKTSTELQSLMTLWKTVK